MITDLATELSLQRYLALSHGHLAYKEEMNFLPVSVILQSLHVSHQRSYLQVMENKLDTDSTYI